MFAALGDDHALGARSGTSISAVTECDLFLMLMTQVLGQPPHAAEQDLRVPLDQHRPAGEIRVEPLRQVVVERQHVVARRLDQPQALQLVQLLGHLLREVVRLAPVLVGVVELPDVVVERRDFLADRSHGVLCRVTAVQPLW